MHGMLKIEVLMQAATSNWSEFQLLFFRVLADRECPARFDTRQDTDQSFPDSVSLGDVSGHGLLVCVTAAKIDDRTLPHSGEFRSGAP